MRARVFFFYAQQTKPRIRRSGLFAVFTSAMLMSHIVLISTNQTTVEHVAARAMKDRESETLNAMHSFWGCVCVFPLLLSVPVRG